MRTAEGTRGYTVRELARLLRVSTDKIRAWIRTGRLPAINTASASCRRPRYVVLPDQLEAFAKHQQAGAPERPARARRAKAADFVDYYPGD
jgi:excisionase family DNA binding protein